MTTKQGTTFGLIAVTALLVLTSMQGCGMLENKEPAQKPLSGPVGSVEDVKPNPPFWERFANAPGRLYDLELLAGQLFEAFNSGDWSKAEATLPSIEAAWRDSKDATGTKKGVKEADTALPALIGAVREKQQEKSFEALGKFMGGITEIGKSYKLSPLSDIVTVDSALRNVSYYLHIGDWDKIDKKTDELEKAWGQIKPSVEQVGIIGEVTIAHSAIKQIRDAAKTQSKSSLEDQVKKANANLAKIIAYYHGR